MSVLCECGALRNEPWGEISNLFILQVLLMLTLSWMISSMPTSASVGRDCLHVASVNTRVKTDTTSTLISSQNTCLMLTSKSSARCVAMCVPVGVLTECIWRRNIHIHDWMMNLFIGGFPAQSQDLDNLLNANVFSENGSFYCGFCDYSSKTKANVKTHLESKHVDKATTQMPCSICHHVCPNRNALRMHMKRQHTNS